MCQTNFMTFGCGHSEARITRCTYSLIGPHLPSSGGDQEELNLTSQCINCYDPDTFLNFTPRDPGLPHLGVYIVRDQPLSPTDPTPSRANPERLIPGPVNIVEFNTLWHSPGGQESWIVDPSWRPVGTLAVMGRGAGVIRHYTLGERVELRIDLENWKSRRGPKPGPLPDRYKDLDETEIEVIAWEQAERALLREVEGGMSTGLAQQVGNVPKSESREVETGDLDQQEHLRSVQETRKSATTTPLVNPPQQQNPSLQRRSPNFLPQEGENINGDPRPSPSQLLMSVMHHSYALGRQNGPPQPLAPQTPSFDPNATNPQYQTLIGVAYGYDSPEYRQCIAAASSGGVVSPLSGFILTREGTSLSVELPPATDFHKRGWHHNLDGSIRYSCAHCENHKCPICWQ